MSDKNFKFFGIFDETPPPSHELRGREEEYVAMRYQQFLQKRKEMESKSDDSISKKLRSSPSPESEATTNADSNVQTCNSSPASTVNPVYHYTTSSSGTAAIVKPDSTDVATPIDPSYLNIQGQEGVADNDKVVGKRKEPQTKSEDSTSKKLKQIVLPSDIVPTDFVTETDSVLAAMSTRDTSTTSTSISNTVVVSTGSDTSISNNIDAPQTASDSATADTTTHSTNISDNAIAAASPTTASPTTASPTTAPPTTASPTTASSTAALSPVATTSSVVTSTVATDRAIVAVPSNSPLNASASSNANENDANNASPLASNSSKDLAFIDSILAMFAENAKRSLDSQKKTTSLDAAAPTATVTTVAPPAPVASTTTVVSAIPLTTAPSESVPKKLTRSQKKKLKQKAKQQKRKEAAAAPPGRTRNVEDLDFDALLSYHESASSSVPKKETQVKTKAKESRASIEEVAAEILGRPIKQQKQQQKAQTPKDKQKGKQPAAQKKFVPLVPCRHYLKGHCREGDKCTFKHDPEQVAPVVRPPTPPRPAVLCNFIKAGSCVRGLECPYSHDLKRLEPCRFFHLDGTCKNGKDCPFSHDPLDDDRRARLHKMTGPCRFYHFKGYCTSGDLCLFSHQPIKEDERNKLEQSLKLCTFYHLQGACQKGDECFYLHDEASPEQIRFLKQQQQPQQQLSQPQQ